MEGQTIQKEFAATEKTEMLLEVDLEWEKCLGYFSPPSTPPQVPSIGQTTWEASYQGSLGNGVPTIVRHAGEECGEDLRANR